MQNPLVRTTYCMPAVASRIKDIESKYYVALRFSIYRDLGTIIAANPSTILAMARLGDREKETLIRDLADGTIDARWEIPAEIRRRAAARRPAAATRRPRRGWSEIVQRDRPASAQGLLAQPSVPVQLDGRDDEGLSPRLSRVLRRDARPRRRPDRLGRTDDHPDRGRHARRDSSTSATTTSSSSPRTRATAPSPRRSRRPT